MVWVRIDDQFPEHPKVAQAGPLAIAMQVAALCYCNRKLTDGFVPRSIARRLLDFEVVDAEGRLWHISRGCGMVGEDVDAAWVIELLVDAGMWEEVPGGFMIHDFHDYQPTKADVDGEREAARERMRNLRANRKRSSEGSSGERSEVVRPNFGGGSVTPVPVPVPKGSKEPSRPSDESDERFDRFWKAYPRGRAGKPGGDGARKPALQKFRRLTAEEQEACLVAVEHYRSYVESPDGPPAAHATTWLNQERWEQWQEPAKVEARDRSKSARQDPVAARYGENAR
jgi:hypothetical protein